MTKTIRGTQTPDETIATVMTAAHRLAVDLVAEGILSGATLGPETGEASCLTLTVLGEPEQYYVQPMWPEEDEYDEPCVELYVEREVPEWEPVPFAVSTSDQKSMQDDLRAMFEFFRPS